jgi:hypothetical protein
MKLSDYLIQNGKPPNPSLQSNALYKTRKSFNCNLTPAQAIEFARHLLGKAQLILDNYIEDAVVQVWNGGEDNESISFGLIEARKGKRRKKGT